LIKEVEQQQQMMALGIQPQPQEGQPPQWALGKNLKH
jgi:hypothetical protein